MVFGFLFVVILLLWLNVVGDVSLGFEFLCICCMLMFWFCGVGLMGFMVMGVIGLGFWLDCVVIVLWNNWFYLW